MVSFWRVCLTAPTPRGVSSLIQVLQTGDVTSQALLGAVYGLGCHIVGSGGPGALELCWELQPGCRTHPS